MSLYSQAPNNDNFLQVTENNNPILQTSLIKTNTGITREFFAQYISYARRYIQPRIPDYVVMDLVQEYCNMRSLGNSKKTITATPRQLESMIRLAEAIAKMRLSETVEKKDIDEAVRLIKTAMQQSATDPITGEIDMDIITTGISTSQSERVKQVMTIINKIKVTILISKLCRRIIEKRFRRVDYHTAIYLSTSKRSFLSKTRNKVRSK